MNKYIFILGNHPQLSQAEIESLLVNKNISYRQISAGDDFLIIETEIINPNEIINGLGGTIKIGVLNKKIKNIKEANENFFIPMLASGKKKINFGFSLYGFKEGDKKAMEKIGFKIKNKLKEKNISSRLVTSREAALSSVIVKKNKLLTSGKDFLILKNGQNIFVGHTESVQDFLLYGKKDFGRPERDTLSGTLPPKIAQIMINLSMAKKTDSLLDPFCGSGTILSEALILGYQNITGTDISEKAITDSKKNMEWIRDNWQLSINDLRLLQLDARELSLKIKPKSIDAIITEPYLGPPLRGRETKKELEKTTKELGELYLAAFREFKKIIKPEGRVAIIIPEFRSGKETIKINILEEIKKIGFLPMASYLYSRPGQKVLRNISLFRVK